MQLIASEISSSSSSGRRCSDQQSSLSRILSDCRTALKIFLFIARGVALGVFQATYVYTSEVEHLVIFQMMVLSMRMRVCECSRNDSS